jgi:hypothetical protein
LLVFKFGPCRRSCDGFSWLIGCAVGHVEHTRQSVTVKNGQLASVNQKTNMDQY